MKQKGFTLLELIVAIVIISVIAMFAVRGFSAYRTTQVHNGEVNKVLALFSEARNRAQSGDSARNYTVTINTAQKQFTIARVTTEVGDIALSETITLDTRITVTETIDGDTVSFERFTGSTNDIGTITITTTSGNTVKNTIIRIYRNGLATLD